MEPLKFLGIKLNRDGFETAAAVVNEHVGSLRHLVPDSDFQKAVRALGDDIFNRNLELLGSVKSGLKLSPKHIAELSLAEQIYAMGQAHSPETMKRYQKNVIEGRNAGGTSPSTTQLLINQTGWSAPKSPDATIKFEPV